MRVRCDLHTHTTYSDGWEWREMAEAAADAGLEAIGFTDHCPVVQDQFGRRDRYDFCETYHERRREFDADADADALGIAVYDGAEVNYDPNHEAEIRSFLDDADFAYTIGSVHFAGEYDIAHPDLEDAPSAERRAAIDRYLDWQVALIESELFDVLGHLDVSQRPEQLRGVMEPADYERLASALSNSRTIPEINAGRLDRSYGTVHPHPDHLEVFAEYDVPFVFGTDSHAPDQLEARVSLADELLETLPDAVEVLDRPPGLD